MSRLITTISVLILLANAFFLRAVYEGRNADVGNLNTKSDAVSYCVRGVAKGRVSWTRFGDCLRASLAYAKIQEAKRQASSKEEVLEKLFKGIEADKKTLKSWATNPPPPVASH